MRIYDVRFLRRCKQADLIRRVDYSSIIANAEKAKKEKKLAEFREEQKFNLAEVSADSKSYKLAKSILEKPMSDDSNCRKMVMNKLIQDMENGITLEDAIDNIMQDPIVEKFEYLRRNGLDLNVCFKNWVQSYLKNIEKNGSRIR